MVESGNLNRFKDILALSVWMGSSPPPGLMPYIPFDAQDTMTQWTRIYMVLG